ncbi:DoxX family membrane protein [Actinomycetes bacterium NPDC127524]
MRTKHKRSTAVLEEADWFDGIGLPGFMADRIASLELIGGIALVLGFWTLVFSLIYFRWIPW